MVRSPPSARALESPDPGRGYSEGFASGLVSLVWRGADASPGLEGETHRVRIPYPVLWTELCPTEDAGVLGPGPVGVTLSGNTVFADDQVR